MVEMAFDTGFVLTVVVVSYNTRDCLRTCLTQLQEAIIGLRARVFVVDNQSSDGSASLVKYEFPHFQLLRSGDNLGFAAAANLALHQVDSRYVIFMTPCVSLEKEALVQAIRFMQEHVHVGIAGGRVAGKMDLVHSAFPSAWQASVTQLGLASIATLSEEATQSVAWVGRSFMIVRREVLRELKELDERFFMDYEDLDLCQRARALGWQIFYCAEMRAAYLPFNYSLAILEKRLLWERRARLLYYRKHHCAITTWFVYQLELRSQGLLAVWARYCKNHSRINLARYRIQMMELAWKDTFGGRVAPRRPW